MSRIASQFCMVMMNHGCDLTGDMQTGVPHENRLAGMPIPASDKGKSQKLKAKPQQIQSGEPLLQCLLKSRLFVLEAFSFLAKM